ncbi:efflux RND transporter periplasmic adaptor subunit [Sulfuriroseicoccus oceanibius]|uniref:Efflux RND transporter periplasmic adaptor subunit n=1 Tax=Sulfuriroseicoccus oceanibius TaxID=2707525 RepID=A0A6B3L2V7_9BACT|nr:efflux RND transporter periplasmic adaptor subunit [Sulfuriroseicoccus oceanibius]QQL46170.1 efflux RND transporter periplasmic adaptor subunit [Sulfuriroseicoccus oceanibius]
MKKVFHYALLPLLVLVLALGIFKVMQLTKPEKGRREAKPIVAQIPVEKVAPAAHVPTIQSFGTVRAFYETRIAALVAGEVDEVAANFQAGESVREGDVLMQINPADYAANVAQQESNVAAAKRVLAEEEARGKQAVVDWKSSGRSLDSASPYTLRVPQQEAARKALASAEAALEKAKLDLERTKVVAPFDAIVQERSASPGGVVTVGMQVGTLIAREKVEVRLPLTPEQVARLKLPLAFQPGSLQPIPITLKSPAYPGVSWQALVTRTEASVDPRNQVIHVIAEVQKPFDGDGAPLPVGTFVTAVMDGRPVEGVYLIPSASLLDDQYVWTVDAESKLRRQDVVRVFSAGGQSMVRVEKDDAKELTVAIRPLASFREGQLVSVAGDADSAASGESGEAEPKQPEADAK